MKKVLNMRYMLQAYRFARDVQDIEMMEQYFFAIIDEIKGKPYLYKLFIHKRMQKHYKPKPMSLFAILRKLT
jgi:hypothetical protein